MTQRLLRFGSASLVASLLSLLPACGGSSPAAPIPPPTVTSVQPASGSTLGGTQVIITGSRFASGAAVIFGGAPATDVTVRSATEIAATTPPHLTGAVDIVVTIPGARGWLPGGFSYVLPGPNQPPVITSIAAQGSRPQEPSGFADLGETIALVAQVQDAETPVDQMEYQWQPSAGTIVGTGRTVSWQAPASATTPTKVTIALTVVEHYTGTDDTGAPVQKENTAAGRTTVSLHDSIKEVKDISESFMVDFSHSDVPTEQVIRNFSDTCAGKAEERNDIEHNRATYTITAFHLGQAKVKVNFGGVCSYDLRKGDACSSVSADWTSTDKTTGLVRAVTGVDYMSAIYLDDRWWLCDSNYAGSTATRLRFIH
jgi:hypothetical protein